MIDRDKYFDAVRPSLFAGAMTQQQVDGQCVLLGLWDYQATGTPMSDIRWLAYLLASVYHECNTTMWPITEMGSQSYLQGKDYYPYVGRGFVMITWEENYRNASASLGLIDDRDLVEHPELALDSLIAARIPFRGCAEGWFTGKKLGEYFNEDIDDPVNARQIINGNDKDTLIAGYYETFLEALEAASPASPAPGPDETSATVELTLTATAPVAIRVLGGENVNLTGADLKEHVNVNLSTAVL